MRDRAHEKRKKQREREGKRERTFSVTNDPSPSSAAEGRQMAIGAPLRYLRGRDFPGPPWQTAVILLCQSQASVTVDPLEDS
jgi:hypothetical protein